MEDIGRIILIIIAIVGAMVGQTIKSKKRKRSDEDLIISSHNNNVPVSEENNGASRHINHNHRLLHPHITCNRVETKEDPYSWLRTGSDFSTPTIERMTAERYFSITNTFNENYGRAEGGRTTNNHQRDETYQQSRSKLANAIVKSSNIAGTSGSAETIRTPDTTNTPLELDDRSDFDLSKAIVYSEILNPKFMDY